MNKKEWRPIEITKQAARRALAVAGITDSATKEQVGLVTAAQRAVLGNITVFIRNPCDESVVEIDAMEAKLALMPMSDKLGLPEELTTEDLAIYERVFG